MPKQKSHRGAAKRFSFTKSGIVRHKQMNANHQVRLKTTKRTRHLRNPGVVDNAGSPDHSQVTALQISQFTGKEENKHGTH